VIDPAVSSPQDLVATEQPADSLPTVHRLYRGDARELGWLETESLHLVVTSPPYWTLKEYNESEGQLGAIAEYDEFMDELDRVWAECARALVPGGRIVCVVGDVCLSRRTNKGRHSVIPLHADIAVRCRRLGLDYLTPILWHKIANASHEVENGSSFLGKPYEPNAIIKNDIEYVLMLRKPGGYRKPTEEQRRLSKLSREEFGTWFRSFWTDLPGASTRDHPAPYPVELAYRLVRMFSFAGDTVLDPFAGTFSTTIAAIEAGRNSIAVELDQQYFANGLHRVKQAAAKLDLFGGPVSVEVNRQFPPAASQEQVTAC
jgi:DNA modification methylase